MRDGRKATAVGQIKEKDKKTNMKRWCYLLQRGEKPLSFTKYLFIYKDVNFEPLVMLTKR